MPQAMPGAPILAGVRVLDFARYIAGPYCATLLGYLGADVIRIEKPGGAEDRYVGAVSASASSTYLETGCNKRGITLDLKRPEGEEIKRRLIASADVVVVNMPPETLKRSGLDYDTLKAIKPDIILTTQTGFGHAGPWANRGGFDGVGQVMSGSAWFSGTPGKPSRSATAYVDFGTASLGAFATLAALYQRRDTGQGQHIQASLLGTALAFFNPSLIEQAVLGLNRVPSGNRGQISAPTDILATLDGHVICYSLGNLMFKRVAELLGASDWLDKPDFDTDQKRGARRDELCARLAAWCAVRSSGEVLDAFARAGVPAAPVLDMDEAMAHPQTRAMGYLDPMAYPDIAGPAPVTRLPVAMSGYAPARRRPPTIGEHTDEVLAELGFTAEQRARLRAQGVI